MSNLYCMIVTGLPACGKTTLASFLGDQLELTVISKDDIKEVLFDTIGFKSRTEKLNLGAASTKIMYHFSELMMIGKRSFILDNNFENIDRAELSGLLKKYGYEAITILMDGDIDAIYNRFVERDKDPTRHPGHVLNTEYSNGDTLPNSVSTIGIDDFERIYTERGMRDFNIGNVMSLDCTEIDNINYQEVLRTIQRMMKEQRSDSE